uniref:Voltage-dependent anion-selective channel protein 3 n=1 Tax=Romanomermis culicivorax TaxID=13658 RepID=A0A915JHH7_ROMCU
MTPPLFADLGKLGRDVFQKGYNLGFLKVETTTKNGNDVELKLLASHNLKTTNFFGVCDFKYQIPQYGLTFVEKWNTNNVLSSEMTVQDKLINNAKFILNTSYAPKSSASLKTEYKHNRARMNTEIRSGGPEGPLFVGAIVFGHEGWFLGYQTGYLPCGITSRFKQNLLAIGAEKYDIAVHIIANLADRHFGGNIYHKVTPELELAADVSLATSGESKSKFGLAAKYDLDSKTTVRSKIDSTSSIAVALSHRITQGLKATVSLAINLQSFYDGNNKLGVGVEYFS